MYRKHKVCLVGLSFALFLLLISTATPGATTSIVEFSAIEHPQPQFSNSLVNLPPPPGMVSYWEFNEGNGGLAADSVGRNDGTLRDGGIWVPGVAGAALDLAPRAYVDCGGDISLTIDDPLTIEAWVLLPNTFGIRTIVQNGANPTNKMYHFAIEDGFLYFDRFDGTTNPANVVRSHLRITPGEWHHVVVLMDAVGHSVTFYVDGDMDTIGGFFDPYTGVPYSRFIIGYGQDPMTGHSPTFFNGLIDEVAVYAALLSDENIQQHYQNGLNGLGYLEGGIEPPAIEATDDSYTTDEDVLLDVSAPGVLANDIGDGITAILEAGPLAGSLTLNGDGSFEYIPVPDFNGVDTFIYSVSDGFEESNNATVTITVNAVNDAPVGVDDGYTIEEDASLDLAAPGILENDYDVDGDALLAALIDAPLHGAVVLNADGSLSYVPDTDWHGTDSLTYQVFDGTDYSGLVTVTVEVEPVGDAPRAQDDSYTTEENIPLIIDALSGVLVNDSDPDDDLLASQIITFPSHGSLDFNVDGSFTYTPDPDWYGVDSFVYEALDGIFTDTATVTITVLPANKPPVASDDFYTTNEDVVLDVDAMNGVLANDNDINGDFLTAVLLSDPSHGSLSFNAEGSFTYTPDPNWYGIDSFTYEVSDGELTDTAIVTITVNSVNDAPVAVDDAYTTDEDVPLNIPAPGILNTDSDIEGGTLEALLVTGASHGMLTLLADGSFVYDPNPDFFGIDSFTYKAFDGELESNVATVIITVISVNDAPVAVDDFYSTDEDTDLSTYGAGVAGVLVNDIDVDGDLLVAILMDYPLHGNLAFDPDGNFLYTPEADFWGTDWFTYYLYDDLEYSSLATVTIIVNPVNDAPIADDDSYTTNEDAPLVVPAPGILAGDTDVDGDSLIAVLLMGPQNGMLILNPDGSFEYTPDPDFFGDDFFQYIAYDGELDSNYAIAIINVISVNDAPVANDDDAIIDEDTSVNIDVLANDFDVDGDSLSVLSVADSSHGTIIINPDGTLTYSPDADYNGPDSFTYTVADGNGATDSGTVTITVNAVNDAPVAVDDAYFTDEDINLQVESASGVLANDYDIEGDMLTAQLISGPSHGSLTLNADGSFDYLPDPDFFGFDTFTYVAFDGELDSNLAIVIIDVISVNDAPVAEDDIYSTDEDIILVIDALSGVLSNDFDVDGDPLTAQIVSGASQGYLVFNTDGSFTYNPNPNWHGVDSFTYEVSDGALTSMATVTITVNSVNDAPVAFEDEYQMDEDGVLSIPAPGLLSNDYDVDGDSFYLDDWSDPAFGYLVVYPDGAFEFIPDPDWNGVTTFEYWVFDGLAHSNVVTVMIIVHPVNDAPIALDDFYVTDEDTGLSTYSAGLTGVLANDFDVDGDFLEAMLFEYPLHGYLVFSPDGNFEYIPDTDFWGTDWFTYYIFDGFEFSMLAMVTVTVNSVNDAPVAFEDEYQMDEDGVLSIPAPGLLSNDYDVDGDSFYLDDWSDPAFGYLVVYPDGAFEFIPNPDWNGVTTFEYWVFDGLEHSNVVTVTIKVNPVNDPPVALDDAYTMEEDGILQASFAEGVLANDYDVDGDFLEAYFAELPSNGILSLNLDGSFTYTPNPDFWGIDSFRYLVYDGIDVSDMATVTVTVNAVADAPVAVDDFYITDEDTDLYTYGAGMTGVLVNDYDADGDPLEAVLMEYPLYGLLAFDPDGNFLYLPDANFWGTDSFTYRAYDGVDYSNIATVTITVNSVNDPPVSVDDAYTMEEDGVLQVDYAAGVLANDYDADGDSLEAYFLDLPSNGILLLNLDGSFRYTPNSDFWGVDSFTYLIYDGIDASDIATVTITVNAVNDAPVAADDFYSTNEDTVLSTYDAGMAGVLVNDYDIEGDMLTAQLISGPSHGSLTLNADGSFDYLPDPDFFGFDTFTYVAFDGELESNIATVTITVNSVNDVPIANDDAYSTNEDTRLTFLLLGVIENDVDADGDSLLIVTVNDPTHGLLTMYPNGSFTYLPDPDWFGIDTFEYAVSDGTTESNLATVTIEVLPVNDAPVAVDDTFSIFEDAMLQAGNVLANDSDIEGSPLEARFPIGPSNGVVVLYADGTFVYAPNPDFYGTDSFSYTAYDGELYSNSATVTITVIPVNDAPVAFEDEYQIDEDGELIVPAPGLLINDYDIEGDFIFVDDWSDPAIGVLWVDEDGSFIFIPDPDWHGIAVFEYRVFDGLAHSNVVTVTIIVNPVDDPPVAVDDYVTTDEDTPITIDVLANDYDIEGDPFSLVGYGWVSGQLHGALAVVNVGGMLMIKYTPDSNWHGSASFYYDIGTTGSGYLDSAYVYITVNSVEDAPVAMNDVYTIDEDGVLQTDAASGVLANDYDGDGDSLTLQLLLSPSYGSLLLNADGSFTYTPDANWYGEDMFEYEVSDGDQTDTATVTITVNPFDDPPVAVDDYVTTDEDTPITIDVLANDYDIEGDSFDLIDYDWSPAELHGELTLVDVGGIPMIQYTPDLNWHGSAWFSYDIGTTGSGYLDSAYVYITVNPVNDAPVAVDDYAITDEDTPVGISVLANDWDVDGDSMFIMSVTQPLHGWAMDNSDGTVTYHPDLNYYGADSFTYTIADGKGGTDTGTVSITVNPVNDVPVGIDDEYTIDEDGYLDLAAPGVLGNDYDVDGDTITAILVSAPYGSGSFSPNGALTYYPHANWHGVTTLTYKVFDGTEYSEIVTVTITVSSVNDAPVAVDDYVVLDEDTSVIIDFMGNDYDVDDAFTMQYVAWSPIEVHGELEPLYNYEVEPGVFRTVLRYTPDADWYGSSSSISYGIRDSFDAQASAKIYITVNPMDDAPVAVDDYVVTDEDTPIIIDVMANDYDVDGDPFDIFAYGYSFAEIHGQLSLVIVDGRRMFRFVPDPNYHGPAKFHYTIHTTGVTGSVPIDNGNVYITVNPVNDAPVGVNDSYTIDEDTSLILPAPGVLSNDYDVDGDTLTLVVVTVPSHGSGVIGSGGSFSYTPDPNWYGTDSFTYRVFDGAEYSGVVTVIITVNSVNDAPVAVDDFYIINEDTILEIDVSAGVLSNDTDVEGDALSVQLVSEPSHGSLIFNSDGSFTYLSDLNWYGVDSFVYEASDDTLTDTATVTITVNPVDDLSVAVDDYVTTDEDTPIVIDVTANDYDVEGDAFFLGAYGCSPPQPYGQLDVVYVGGVAMMKYTPNPDWHGSAWFTYDIYKRVGSTSYRQSRAYVYVTVNSVPDVPVAVDDFYTINEDNILQVDAAAGVLANDSDGDGDALTPALISGPSHGSLIFNADGSFTYTPDLNWYGTDSFVYEASDGVLTGTATVTITVNPVDDPSVAVDDYVTTDEDTAIVIDVTANDYDVEGDAFFLGAYGCSPPQPYGQLDVVYVDGVAMMKYTPNPNWHGSAWFTYDIYKRVGSTSYHQDRAYVYITVIPVNDAPVGIDDSYTIDEDTSLDLAAPGLLGNDYDVDGDAITLDVLTVPTHGSGSISADGSFSYNPNPDWYGTDSLTYRVFDGTEYSGIVTVTITVNPVNDAPVGVDDEYTIDEDGSLNIAAPGVLSNDYDVDGDTITAILVDTPYGSGSFSPNGALSYYPPADWHGVTTLTYQVYDGTDYSGIVTVTITVNSVNDAPVGVNDSYTIDEDTPLILPAPGVLSNDYDVDGDAITLEVLTVPAHGSGSIGLSGSFSYTPESNWYGTDSFTYRVFDGTDYSGIVTVTITVNSVNDAPVGVNDSYAIDEDTSLNLAAPGLLANDYDIDGDTLTLVVVTVPSHGSGSIGSGGSFSYTPESNWYGTDSFMYRVYDGIEYSGVVIVTVTVKPINDAPVAVDDAYTTDEDVSLIAAAPGVLGNDHDIDSDSLIAILIDAPLHGSVTFNADGSLNYVPDADWYGVDTLMYQVFDGTEHSNIATVTITVAPVNDAPVAEDDAYTTDEDTILLGDLVTGVLANDFDIDGDIMAASLVSGPSHGILTLNPDGSFSYIPDANWYGVDSFVYEVSDGALTDTATVIITVNSVNDSPVAVDDAYPTEVGVPLIVAVPGVLANDYDIDNDPLEALLIDSPMHGTIVLFADGSFAYAPDACWCGVDTFSYKVFDGFEYSNIALVTLTVIDVTPPVTMVQFTGVEGEYGWYHSDVEVTLTATDDASGVASTVYSLNGFTWIPYSGPFVLSNPGEVTVYYYSTDNAGNVEDVKSATIKIGKPTRSFVTGGGWIYDSGEKGHFAFVVKYKCGVLKGHLIYSFKADGYKYIVKSTHWFGMAIDGNHALLEGNAKIMRYSYETRKWECFGNFYFRVEIWDNGKCKRDIFQIQIFDKSCELFHEAGFDPLGEVHHGSIQIHEHGPKCWCRCWCMKKWR